MQFIEAQDSLQLFDVYCDCETESGKSFSMKAFGFDFLSSKTFDMKFEANSNLKTFPTISQSDSVFILQLLIENFFWFLSNIISCVTWTIVLNKLKNHLSKPGEEEKKTTKRARKKVKICVFIFLSHKTTESYATKLELQPTIHIHIAVSS